MTAIILLNVKFISPKISVLIKYKFFADTFLKDNIKFVGGFKDYLRDCETILDNPKFVVLNDGSLSVETTVGSFPSITILQLAFCQENRGL